VRRPVDKCAADNSWHEALTFIFCIAAACAAAAGAGAVQYGKWYEIFKNEAQSRNPSSPYGLGLATYTYPTAQRPTQLWYHDHV
jgi:hypothetical protein